MGQDCGRGVGAVRSVLVLTVVSAAVTIAFFLSPATDFADSVAGVREALQTGVTLVGALIAYLVWARYRKEHRLDDLLLVEGVLLLSIAPPLWEAIGHSAPSNVDALTIWGSAATRLAAATLLVASAIRSIAGRHPRATPTPQRVALFVAGIPVPIVGALVVSLTASSAVLPMFADVEAHGRQLTNAPAFATLMLLMAAQFGLAATLFARRADGEHDRFLQWVALAAILSSFASLGSALYPTIAANSLSLGDAFRILATGGWLISGIHELTSYQDSVAGMARVAERRRIARDLHDGLAQELTFLTGRATLLTRSSKGVTAADLEELVAAGRRALLESRRAVMTLSEPHERPLTEDLRTAAEDVASRDGTAVQVSVDPSLSIGTDRRETMVRIVREAVHNAALHGKAGQVEVEFATVASGPRLRIRDDGAGFDVTAVTSAGRGFGLISMRERAGADGAEFAVYSVPGRGTTVEVRWP